MRKPIVAMSQKNYNNKIIEEKKFLNNLLEELVQIDTKKLELAYFPSLGLIPIATEILKDTNINVGAQNISPILNGATTGEYSIETLKDYGGNFVEIGHAERRNVFFESSNIIHQKILLTFEEGLKPLVCIGESEYLPAFVRKNIFKNDLMELLKDVSEKYLTELTIAYEPIWAIGKIKAADSQYIFESHVVIREILTELYGIDIANSVRIIYGGSVNIETTKEIIVNENVDGVFVGRYGHDPKKLAEIINIVSNYK
ncbi:triosephosphate isomerase [Granulicatella balaenopterae]|uniref:Triosephosphate isomerase n=1 Tax=Granulicatella balaenopterae TaxID=137733 RepID=A0A1H9P352_9LACT|nr:triose-phosphate isomerase family protein [Granulicatella balaenopterae]SER42551.1 triosephosphate isomerase [Granulicatella balaenopterae]